MKSSTKKYLIALAALVVLIGVFVLIHGKFSQKPVQGTKAYTVEVIDDKGDSKLYTGKTDAEFLSNLMDELKEKGDFSYEGSTTEYGLYITAINGLSADYNVDGAYWSIMVNSEYGQYGADAQPVADGDAFQFVYTKAQ